MLDDGDLRSSKQSYLCLGCIPCCKLLACFDGSGSNGSRTKSKPGVGAAERTAQPRTAGPDAAGDSTLRRSSPSEEHNESLVSIRRKKLSLIGVLNELGGDGPLQVFHLLIVAQLPVVYFCFVFPRIREFGFKRWQMDVAAGVLEKRAGGPFAEVSWAFAFLLSLAYVTLVWLGARRMERCSPVRMFIFECMAVHNLVQCGLNLYCLAGILHEGWQLGLGVWGNELDISPRGYTLGGLIWLQYHCRQLQLLDTGFMVLRRKFGGLSFVHLYLRVLNLCGWYIACRYVCGGEAFFPTLVSSVCQSLVYGSYFAYNFAPSSGSRAGTPPWAAGIAKVQITQYVVCAFHSILASVFGNFPAGFAALHLFVIGNGLVLYTDFQSEAPKRLEPSQTGNPDKATADGTERKQTGVSFSFDACGWLCVYHFGAGYWLKKHLGFQDAPKGNAWPSTVTFSGSSGGAIVACVLAGGECPKGVFEDMIDAWKPCRENPRKMFPIVETVTRKYAANGAKRISGRLRVLLTRVCCRPPFLTGEVLNHWSDDEMAVKTIAASCHFPLLAGILPKRIGDRYYYDGLVWPSRLLVQWRGAKDDHVVRVSAVSLLPADISCSPIVPLWWGGLPPQPDILRGIFWRGYRDAAMWFSAEPAASSDQCGCRRAAASNATEEKVATWRAAHALRLRSEPMPEVDPLTGQNVQELIKLAEEFARRELKLLRYAFLTLLALVAAVVLSLDPVSCAWLRGVVLQTGV